VIFADLASPNPAFVSSWLAVALILMGGALTGIGCIAGWRAIFPLPTKLKQPLKVEKVVEFATAERVEKVEGELSALRAEVQEGFQGIREDRSRSTGNLHQRIESMEFKAQARTDELRREIKTDVRGVHERINEVLAAVNRVSSSVEVCQKIHLKE